jgi:Zn-finger nucleic acid-binding protein
MESQTLDGTLGRDLTIDLCTPCQAFWFDGHESLQLSPGATLSLFRLIGEHAARPQVREGDVTKCPRCASRLRRTSDMQRSTRFEYHKCPHEHGRLISFFDFLKSKDFVKPLSARELEELRQHIQMVNCSNCGGPIDLAHQSTCPRCGSPLSMLDLKQAEKLVEQLRHAGPASKAATVVHTHSDSDGGAFRRSSDSAWFADVSSSGLVGAGLHLVVRWLSKDR